MNELTDQPGKESTCPKRVWVMSVLSDDEILLADDEILLADDEILRINDEPLRTGSPLPQGLEFHLSRCPSCRALAGELQAVTRGLAELASEDTETSLLNRANRQAMSALMNGARMTGRVEVTTEQIGRPETVAAWWRSPKLISLTTAAAIVLAIGLYGLRSMSGHGAGGGLTDPNMQMADDTSLTIPKKEKTKAALASDRDPTAIPPAYRGDDCEGDNCPERAFVPRRGRRPTKTHRLDTAAHKESTMPAPNDP